MGNTHAEMKDSAAVKGCGKPVPDSFYGMGKRAPLLLFGILCIISFFVFKGYILQCKYYLFKGTASDSVNGLYPYYYLAADHLAKYGMPGWSFNFGMGHSLFPFLFQDPFAVFLYIAGKDNIMSCMIYKELGKIMLAGMLFFYYLRLLKLSDFTAITGALLFAFCGFMIVGSVWYLFSFEACNFALLLLAFELLFTRRKWYLFPFATFLMAISQPVNLYLYGVFLALYTVLRLFHTSTFSVKNLFVILMKMTMPGLTGILLAGPFFLENVFQLLNSPRGSGANSPAHLLMSEPVFGLVNKHQFGTSVLRFFSNDMPGTAQYWNGWWNYLEVPEYYCGLPCLLLMPQVFCFLDRKMRFVFAAFLSLWFTGLVFPYFRHVFWLFSGDYYRAYSFFGAFCFLFFSLLALDLIVKRQKINVVVLLTSLALLLFVLYYPFFPPREQLVFPDKLAVTHPIFVFVSISLVLYCIVLYFLSKPRTVLFVRYLFLGMVISELTYLSHFSVNNLEEIHTSELNMNFGYHDHQLEAINFLKQNDHSFFRIDKGCFSSPTRFFSYNDGMVQDYKGTCVYNSFNQLNYVFYLQFMGVVDKANEMESRWAIGVLHRPVLESENSVKYILTKKFTIPFWDTAFDSIASFGDVKVLRNKYVLPLDYTYPFFIKESNFSGLTNEQKDLVSLRACVVKDNDVSELAGMKEFNLNDTVATGIFNAGIYRAYINELKKDTLTILQYNDNHVHGNIHLKERKMMYVSIPCDKGWRLKVDGKPKDKIMLNAGITGVLLTPGEHRVELDFEPPFLRMGIVLSVAGIFLYGVLIFYRKKLKALSNI